MLSIIIPTYNEAKNIGSLVGFLNKSGSGENVEIIVSDAGSTDETLKQATLAGAIAIVSPNKGRAAQMNFGASIAKGDTLYFVHADVYPPKSFITDISNAINEGFDFGRFQTKFNSKKWILKVNAFFTRFDWFVCYGGDQTLFITRKLFDKIAGYNNEMLIMEDYEIVTRAKKYGRYKIFSKPALVSARKYETNSWMAVQRANKTIVDMYKKGASQQAMIDKYKRMLNYG